MNGYPDGCTQSTHDAEYNQLPDPDEVNDRIAAVEEQARREIIEVDERFTGWLDSDPDAAVAIARHFAHCLQIGGGCHQLAAWQLEGQIVSDYQSYRVAETGL